MGVLEGADLVEPGMGRWNVATPADLLPPDANDPNQVYIGVEPLRQ